MMTTKMLFLLMLSRNGFLVHPSFAFFFLTRYRRSPGKEYGRHGPREVRGVLITRSSRTALGRMPTTLSTVWTLVKGTIPLNVSLKSTMAALMMLIRGAWLPIRIHLILSSDWVDLCPRGLWSPLLVGQVVSFVRGSVPFKWWWRWWCFESRSSIACPSWVLLLDLFRRYLFENGNHLSIELIIEGIEVVHVKHCSVL